MSIITTKPGALSLEQTAEYLSLSPTLVKQNAQTDPEFPKPVQLSARRVGWRTAELDAWLASRPVSQCLPPVNSGYGRRGKPATASS